MNPSIIILSAKNVSNSEQQIILGVYSDGTYHFKLLSRGEYSQDIGNFSQMVIQKLKHKLVVHGQISPLKRNFSLIEKLVNMEIGKKGNSS